MSKKYIQDLATQIASLSNEKDTSLLLDKVRELYERVIVMHYTKTEVIEEEIATHQEKTVPEKPKEVFEATTTHLEEEKRDLSVQDRIQQIMENARKLNKKTALKNEKPNTVHKELEAQKNREEIPKKAEEVKEEPVKTIPKAIEEEFKDAISADLAADMFEKAEKIEITKKSLNDKLSQKQIQIGLNDRIAFVKHLFNGSQVDFNRVLSQLNSFETEEQAMNFVNNMVRTEHNWEGQSEYEERFITLIERKFL
jgi:hypothetical protein